MSIAALRYKRGQLIDQAQRILRGAVDEGNRRALTTAEASQVDSLLADVAALRSQIEAAEAEMERKVRTARPIGAW